VEGYSGSPAKIQSHLVRTIGVFPDLRQNPKILALWNGVSNEDGILTCALS